MRGYVRTYVRTYVYTVRNYVRTYVPTYKGTYVNTYVLTHVRTPAYVRGYTQHAYGCILEWRMLPILHMFLALPCRLRALPFCCSCVRKVISMQSNYKRYAHPAEANWRLGSFPDMSSSISLRLVAELSPIDKRWSANLCVIKSVPRLSPSNAPQEHSW